MNETAILFVTIGIVASLTAAATAVRTVSRIWLRHWVERRLSGSQTAELFLDRPQRLLLAASTGVAIAVFFAGTVIGSMIEGGVGARVRAILVYAFALLLVGTGFPLPTPTFPIVHALTLMAALGLARVVYRLRQIRRGGREGAREAGAAGAQPVLLVGAGEGADLFLRALEYARGASAYRVIGLLALTGRQIGRRINGHGILGTLDQTGAVLQRLRGEGGEDEEGGFLHKRNVRSTEYNVNRCIGPSIGRRGRADEGHGEGPDGDTPACAVSDDGPGFADPGTVAHDTRPRSTVRDGPPPRQPSCRLRGKVTLYGRCPGGADDSASSSGADPVFPP